MRVAPQMPPKFRDLALPLKPGLFNVVKIDVLESILKPF